MASGKVQAGWWGPTSPSGYPMGPQSSIDTEAARDALDEQALDLKRQRRREVHEQKWASLPGPETWRRVR